MAMAVKMMDLPLDDRPRERLLRRGVTALSDAELIAVQLGSGHAGASALDVAQRLLADWGGVTGLASARPEEMAHTAGVGPAKAARLAAAFNLSKRGTSDSKPILRTSADVAREANLLIGNSRTERFLVLVVNGSSRLKRAEIVASGSAKACPVPIREIIAMVLRNDGVAFAVAHNHPGGDPTPTSADVKATEALREAAGVVGLRFLDHVIVAGSAWQRAGMQTQNQSSR